MHHPSPLEHVQKEFHDDLVPASSGLRLVTHRSGDLARSWCIQHISWIISIKGPCNDLQPDGNSNHVATSNHQVLEVEDVEGPACILVYNRSDLRDLRCKSHISSSWLVRWHHESPRLEPAPEGQLAGVSLVGLNRHGATLRMAYHGRTCDHLPEFVEFVDDLPGGPSKPSKLTSQ